MTAKLVDMNSRHGSAPRSDARKKKVLFASVNAGLGHHALRDSLIRALKAGDRADRFTAIPFTSSNKSIDRIYRLTMALAPKMQRFWWWLSDRPWFAQNTAQAQPSLYKEAKKILTAPDRPDVVVSTHLGQTITFAQVKHELGLDVPIVGAIPDYGQPTLGFYPYERELRADHLILMDELPYEHYLNKRGVPAVDLHLCGLLTHDAFRDLAKKLGPCRDVAAKRSLIGDLVAEFPQAAKLDPTLPTLLFAGGSRWTRRTMPVLKRVAADPLLSTRVNVVVVCGDNPSFFAQAQERFGALPTFQIYPFVQAPTLAKLMALADVPVLGSIAPATMHELLELGCGPLLVFRFIEGSENEHIPYLERHQLGVYEPRATHMLDLIAQIVGLKPKSVKIAALTDGFAARAALIREQHERRAMSLSQYLERISNGASTAVPSRRQAGAVG